MARPVRSQGGTLTRFAVENDLTAMSVVVAQVEEELCRLGPDEATAHDVGVSLREALANAIYHGNLELPPDLRDIDDGRPYDELALRRSAIPPYSKRRVDVQLRRTNAQLTCIVADEGPGFDPASVPDPTDPAFLERPHGRGLFLIRLLMDEVEHNARGNVITMVKHLRG